MAPIVQVWFHTTDICNRASRGNTRPSVQMICLFHLHQRSEKNSIKEGQLSNLWAGGAGPCGALWTVHTLSK